MYIVIAMAGAGTVRAADDGTRYFQMGGKGAPAWPGFTMVAPDTGYSGERTFGWLTPEARLAGHTTPEPDAVPVSDISGTGQAQVDFRVDLSNGDYTVWVLTGAMGNIWRLRYLRAPHELLVQGRIVERVAPAEGDLFRCANYDWRKDDDVYDQFVAPRYAWLRNHASVTDGKLVVGFRPGADFPICAIVVARAQEGHRVEASLQNLDARRKEAFYKRWQLSPAPPRTPATVSIAERRRGYVVAQVDCSDDLDPWSQPAPGASRARLEVLATPGEEEQTSLAVFALQNLHDVKVSVTDLRDETGHIISSAAVGNGLVQFLPWPVDRGRRQFTFKEILLLPGRPTYVGEGTCKRFWLTLHVPPHAKAGTYRGRVTISAANAESSSLELVARVVPIRLASPPLERFLYFGTMYYLARAYLPRFDEASYWESMRAEVRFLKENGFSRAECILSNPPESHLTIRHGTVVDVDLAETEKLMAIVREEGAFPRDGVMICRADTLVTQFGGRFWRPSGPAMEFIPTADGKDNFIRAVRIIDEKARAAAWPQVVFEVGGEYSNFGEQGKRFCLAAEAALKEAGAHNTLRGNGAMDMAAVLQGLVEYPQPNWAMMRTDWLGFMKSHSARLWGYNYTRSRFAMGWFTFRHNISRVSYEAGIYANGQPGNAYEIDTDEPLGLPTGITTIAPTVWLKRLVQGEVDYEYLCTLDRSIREAERSGRPVAADVARRARSWLDGKLSEIPHGIDYPPNDPRADAEAQGSCWPRRELDANRAVMAKFITAIDKAMGHSMNQRWMLPAVP